MGNDEVYFIKYILQNEGIHDLYDRSYIYKNFTFIGLESSTSGPALFKHTEKDFQHHLKHQYSKVSTIERCIVVSHTPPFGLLDRGIRFAGKDEGTRHIGSTALRHFIEMKPIDLVICGHCHSHGGMTEKLGNTTIVNVASHDSRGAKGNFAVIEVTSTGEVTVEWHDTSEVIDGASLLQIYGIGPIRAGKIVKCGITTIRQLAEHDDFVEVSKKTRMSEAHLLLIQLRAKSMLTKEIYQIAPFSLDCVNAIFFDIETDIACEKVWLIGIKIDDTFLRFYADNWTQEQTILERFTEFLKDHPNRTLISYSGTNFDHRVTLHALQRHGIPTDPLTSRPHIDLSTNLRRCFIFPNQRFALKDLGTYLGYPFKHLDLDGFAVALTYHNHVDNGEPLDPKILEYNQDDVEVIPYLINKIGQNELIDRVKNTVHLVVEEFLKSDVKYAEIKEKIIKKYEHPASCARRIRIVVKTLGKSDKVKVFSDSEKVYLELKR